jgi:hypothetical protein
MNEEPFCSFMLFLSQNNLVLLKHSSNSTPWVRGRMKVRMRVCFIQTGDSYSRTAILVMDPSGAHNCVEMTLLWRSSSTAAQVHRGAAYKNTSHIQLQEI